MSENMKLPLIGDRAPEFTAQTTKGVIDFPNGYKGKWVVLFSHPGDFTPVCTTEFYAFASRAGDFKALGTELVGLSVDQVYAHMKWTEWIKEKLGKEIPFPVIADSTGKVATKYGMLQPEAKGTQAVRAVFILDGEGVVRTILYYPLSVGRNIDEILRIIKALQVSDKEGVSLPANWPKNELIGDRVIVPAPTNEDEAKDRTKKYECYDWWFCHRKLE